MKPYNIHPDFAKFRGVKMPLSPAILPSINYLMPQMLSRLKLPEGLKETIYKIPGYKSAEIRLSMFEPELSDADPLPCLVYFHGGAFAIQAAPQHRRQACEFALKTPCKVAFVDYRLLPDNTYPVGLGDCFAAYGWVCDKAADLGIDEQRIAVGGDSAGGALAAGVCLLARDRGLSMPCFQMLIYPVTDRRQDSKSMREFSDTPLWNGKLNADMWKMYLKDGEPENPEYASPAEAASLAGMPPSYVEVAQFDCLHDEGVAFAERLMSDGVSCELYETQGTIHGFEVAKSSSIVAAATARRVERLKAAFYNK